MKLTSLTILIMPVFVVNFFIFSGNAAYSQFKEIPSETKTKLKSGGLILGFINPKNFSVSHSINVSYQSFGNSSVSLTSYTATLSYKVLENMKLSADVTMQYSPYASIGSNPVLNKEFQNSFNGINLSRVSLDYRPFKNMFISIDYVNYKNNLYWYDNYYYLNNRYRDYTY
ncbi:MAG: hypothetical protein L0Y79_07780 [Chlorobi bacterium]|nr:hypothetical protein [Chlorobiota bacterium]MCI0715607.1 hypothetical protein [Chlorobiota bacterium]